MPEDVCGDGTVPCTPRSCYALVQCSQEGPPLLAGELRGLEFALQHNIGTLRPDKDLTNPPIMYYIIYNRVYL